MVAWVSHSSPLSFICADEELGSVGVGTRVSHGQYAGPYVLQLEVLIRKLLSIDGFASSSIVVGKVSALKIKLTQQMWQQHLKKKIHWVNVEFEPVKTITRDIRVAFTVPGT